MDSLQIQSKYCLKRLKLRQEPTWNLVFGHCTAFLTSSLDQDIRPSRPETRKKKQRGSLSPVRSSPILQQSE